MDELGARLTEERKRLGYTQADFGALGGVERNAQGHYEAGRRVPDASYLAAIAAHGADIVYILTGTPGGPVDALERELVRRFRGASNEIRAAVLAVLGQMPSANAPSQHIENVGQLVAGSQKVKKQTFNVGALPKKGGKPR